MDVSDNQQEARDYHTAIIAKYESVMAGLDKEADAGILTSLQTKVNASKQAITAMRPLPSQIASLEAWLDRKSAKLLEYQRTIVDTHHSFLTLKEDVAAKRSELLKLKQQHATEVAGQPLQPLDITGQLRNASLEHQLSGLNVVLRQVATALSTMANAPPAIKTMLEPFVGSLSPSAPTPGGTVLPSSPLGPPLPTSPLPAQVAPRTEDVFGDTDSYGPVASPPQDTRSCPFGGDSNLDQLAQEAAAAHLNASQVAATSPPSAPQSFSPNSKEELHPG